MRAAFVVGAVVAMAGAAGCTSVLGDFSEGASDAGRDVNVPATVDAGESETDAGEDAELDATSNDQSAPVSSGSLAITPLAKDFGEILVGQSSSVQAFTLTNNGPSSTGAIEVSVSPTAGTSASEFLLTDGCSGSTLAPTATCSVSVAFAPANRGMRAATLVVGSVASGKATASLTGTAIAPATLAFTPPSYAFPPTPVADAGATETFVLSNGGDVTSGVITTGLTVGPGGASNEFAVASDGCKGQTLAAQGSCKIVVQFEPATFGAKSANLTVNGGSVEAPITGTGEDFLSLTVTDTGIGAGTVTDEAGSIECGSTCNGVYARTTTNPVVVLTATPSSTSTFAGWGDACGGSRGNQCQVTLSSPTTSVSAQFTCTICNGVCVDGANDPANCGACGHGCLGGSCTNSVCDPFDYYVPTDSYASGVAADSSYVYWAESTSAYGDVKLCSLATGPCSSPLEFISDTPNATSGIPGGGNIAEGGGYLAAVGGGISDGTSWGGARMESCPLASATTPSTCAPVPEIVTGGGAGGDFAQVATDGVTIASTQYSGVYLVPIGLSPPEQTGNAAVAYAAGGGNQLEGITFGPTAGASYLYWSVAEANGVAGNDSHQILRCEMGGGKFPCSTTGTPGPAQLVYDGGTTNKNPGALAFDATAQMLYWLDQGSTPSPPPYATDGKLLACSIATLPCVPTVLASGLYDPTVLAQDAAATYFASGDTGNVWACAKTGCKLTPIVLASSEVEVDFIAADSLTTGGSVFWSSLNGLRRVAKP